MGNHRCRTWATCRAIWNTGKRAALVVNRMCAQLACTALRSSAKAAAARREGSSVQTAIGVHTRHVVDCTVLQDEE